MDKYRKTRDCKSLYYKHLQARPHHGLKKAIRLHFKNGVGKYQSHVSLHLYEVIFEVILKIDKGRVGIIKKSWWNN